MALSILLGVPLGVFAALRYNQWPDFALRMLSVLGVAVAAFWVAIMLQLLFAMQLGWLPLRGELVRRRSPPPVRITGSLLLDSLLTGRFDALRDALAHLVLPAVTLALGGLASIVRFTRAGVLDTLQQDFVTYERAMGYRRMRLIWRYVLRNSVTATITQIGLLFGGLIAGGVVVEAIFDWPGIGSYTVQRDPDRRSPGDAGGHAAGRRRLCRREHPDRRGAWPGRSAPDGPRHEPGPAQAVARPAGDVRAWRIVVIVVLVAHRSAPGSRPIPATPRPRICAPAEAADSGRSRSAPTISAATSCPA